MISNLTFKQENTIADEPVVDLLTYLNNMSDRLGHSCGQGMTSIWTEPITTACLDHCTDGRFHEKENL